MQKLTLDVGRPFHRPVAIKDSLLSFDWVHVHRSTRAMPATMPAGLKIGGKFTLNRKIGSGSFGEVYSGTHLATGTEVAVKLEPTSTPYPQLAHEARVFERLAQSSSFSSLSSTSTHSYSYSSSSLSSHTSSSHPPSSASSPSPPPPLGVARLWWYGTTTSHNIMVVDLLGPSLEDLFSFCSRQFTLKTTLLLADQLVQRLEFLHGKGFLHRDVKPDNFLMGVGEESHLVHYRERRNLTGTARYSSLRTHLGIEQSRRDDLEALSYVLIYFLRGSLPWQGLRTTSKAVKYDLILSTKQSTSIPSLCAGLPREFGELLRSHYVREEPKDWTTELVARADSDQDESWRAGGVWW
ncbi:hypothetical protein RQP46_008930 [Phenoliferia psychrophenolica]